MDARRGIRSRSVCLFEFQLLTGKFDSRRYLIIKMRSFLCCLSMAVIVLVTNTSAIVLPQNPIESPTEPNDQGFVDLESCKGFWDEEAIADKSMGKLMTKMTSATNTQQQPTLNSVLHLRYAAAESFKWMIEALELVDDIQAYELHTYRQKKVKDKILAYQISLTKMSPTAEQVAQQRGTPPSAKLQPYTPNTITDHQKALMISIKSIMYMLFGTSNVADDDEDGPTETSIAIRKLSTI